MLKSKSLDDQTFEQILQSAMNRLPALCPEWTDYNLHDPGITVVELFSWYEEMQRFHLDQMTEEIRRKLLALLGVSPEKGTPSVTMVVMQDREGFWPEGTRMHTRENIGFELADSIRIGTTAISKVHLKNSNCDIDVTDLLEQDSSFFHPFRYGTEDVDLFLELENVDSEELRLLFRVEEDSQCPRNPFTEENQSPRVIRWFWNGQEIQPEKDATHALSISGEVVLRVTAGSTGTLQLKLEDPGCEETVSIGQILTQYCMALQQETWSRLFTYTVPAVREYQSEIAYGPAISSELTVFLRTERGWEQTRNGREEQRSYGKHLCLDTSLAAVDGAVNLMVVCTVDGCLPRTLFSSDGLPGQTLPLSLEGSRPVGDLLLICDSREKDGRIRPELWREVDDLCSSGPEDRVFTYDPEREILRFGDGLHGAVVPAGENTILVANLIVSQCAMGNIPGATSLLYEAGEAQLEFQSIAGTGGKNPESCQEACIRFLKKFSDTKKCATAADYERIASGTPGLRVAKTKALPGFNPENPFGDFQNAFVNVVVVPYAQTERPLPDRRFLEAVEKQLNAHRPICTRIGVIPPKYIGVSILARMQADRTVNKESVERVLKEWFTGQTVGQSVVVNDLAVFLQKQTGVWKLDRISISADGSVCRKNSMGDLILPPDGLAYLAETEMEFC